MLRKDSQYNVMDKHKSGDLVKIKDGQTHQRPSFAYMYTHSVETANGLRGDYHHVRVPTPKKCQVDS